MMTAAAWKALEQQLDTLFAPGCDPYRAGASLLRNKSPEAITQDERDLVKSVVMRVLRIRSGAVSEIETLRRSADLFHEIGSALAADALTADARNAIFAEKLRENQRSPDQLRKIASDGFELCVRALAAAGASDVTIHECGVQALGETPWSGSDA